MDKNKNAKSTILLDEKGNTDILKELEELLNDREEYRF